MAPSAQRSPQTGGARKFIPFVLTCAGLYAYHNSFRGPFIFDDLNSISGNPTIRQLWSAMSPPPRSPVTGRPIVNLSLAANYALGGLNVWGYHVVNLAIHILASLVLYGVVRRTLRCPSLRERYGEEAPWLALAVALVWVVHPLQTESVTYMTQRTELLMALFFLLTLYCVIRGFESSRPGAWYAGAVASSGLGMGSKEVMAVVPVVVLAYDRLFLSKSFRDTFRHRWSLYAGLAATWLIFGALVQPRVGRGIARLGFGALVQTHMAGGITRLGSSEVTPWDYLKTQAGVIVHYLRLAFWPHPLVGDYGDWPVAKSLTTVLPSAAVVMTLLGATAWAFHRRLRPAFLGVWFFLILAPTSSVWPLVTEVAVERRMYLPLAAVIVLVVIGGYAVLGEVCRRLGWETVQRVLGAIVLVAIVATLAQLTVRRNEDYRSATSFWSDVVAKRPNDALGHNNLGAELYKEARVDEALGRYAEALRIRPNYAEAHYNLGTALASQGKLEEAIAHYSEAVRIRPNYAEPHYNLGNALAGQGKLEEAIAHYSEAVRINPKYADAHVNLGIALSRQGKLEEAIAHYSEAVRINPTFAQAHYNLGVDLASQGKIEEAIAHYSEAVRINPTSAQAQQNLGAALARQGNLKEAIAHYSQALQIAPSAAVHYNLATALTRDGRTQEAIRHLEAALKLNPGYQQARRALADLTSSGAK